MSEPDEATSELCGFAQISQWAMNGPYQAYQETAKEIQNALIMCLFASSGSDTCICELSQFWSLFPIPSLLFRTEAEQKQRYELHNTNPNTNHGCTLRYRIIIERHSHTHVPTIAATNRWSRQLGDHLPRKLFCTLFVTDSATCIFQVFTAPFTLKEPDSRGLIQMRSQLSGRWISSNHRLDQHETSN